MSKTAFITGATKGIGRAIAMRLATNGYDLLLLGRDEAALADVAAECRGNEVEAHVFAGDLTDEHHMLAAVEFAADKLGDIDVLINNAGIASRRAVQDADIVAWREVMALNFDAIMFLSRLILPTMVTRKSGTIINISSISGRNTNAGGAIYCASKHALNGFSGCLFEDVREYGIKVSTIMPGFVDTALTADLALNHKHMIQAQDIADAVEYVVNASNTCCPTEIVIRPQQRP